MNRTCSEGGEWLPPNFSGCTLSSVAPDILVVFSLYYRTFGNSANISFLFENPDLLEREVNISSIICVSQYRVAIIIIFIHWP